MIMLHGLAVSHRYLMPLAAGLAGHHPVHVVDLPGFGLSDDPGTVLDVPEHADHVAAWLAAAGMPSAVVVGNSFGCQVAVELAVRYPDRVAGTLAHALEDPIEHKLPRVRVPTLVTRGSREPIVPMAWATTATRLLPTAELAVVPGPHNANYGAAGHLTDLVLAFVRRRITAKPDPLG
jgi:pimeloyl-ACP methyl ester carboxylesterase